MSASPSIHLAIDLGAESGRIMAGAYDGNTLHLDEVHRFPNTMVTVAGSTHWDILRLYDGILEGLKKAADHHGEAIVSLGVDTWGVDYGLIDAQGKLLGNPYVYRDSRTDGMEALATSLVSRESIYEATGIQFMFFNTLFQLLAETRAATGALRAAERLLFTPDLIHYWLSGVKANERTIASTSQLFNPVAGDWAHALLGPLGLPAALLGNIVEPGTELGMLLPEVAELTGLPAKTRVIAPGSHDTASAVAGVPFASGASTRAFLSSGTWSLIGLELPEPVITAQSLKDGFSNEAGVGGTTRFLKNISGLWLVQECRRAWATDGKTYDYDTLTRLAAEAKPFRSLVDPDHGPFATPGNMPEKIAAFCQRSGQPVPETPGAFVRCCLESLALKCRSVWDNLLTYCQEKPDTLHIVGGGSRNALLNQFIANALGCRVVAGPVEATSLGNILIQMQSTGHIDSLAQGRALVARSTILTQHIAEDRDIWADAQRRFNQLSLQ